MSLTSLSVCLVDIETLATLRFVCKVFNRCWVKWIKQYINGTDDEGYILSGASFENKKSTFIDIIDIHTMLYKYHIIIATDNNDKTRIIITPTRIKVDAYFIELNYMNSRITKNVITALESYGDDVSVIKSWIH